MKNKMKTWLIPVLALGMTAWLVGCDVEDDCDGGFCDGGIVDDFDGGGGEGGGGEGGEGGEGGGGEGVTCTAACADQTGTCMTPTDPGCPGGNADDFNAACIAACGSAFEATELDSITDCTAGFALARNDSAIDALCEDNTPVIWGTGGGCTGDNGEPGICGPTSLCSEAGGSSEAGHCDGAANIQCCIDYPCGNGGACLDDTEYDCGGEWQSGLCPGGNTIRCCEE